MTEIEELVILANQYENLITSNFNKNEFYAKCAYGNEKYENGKKEITKSLSLIGGGNCCEVYWKNKYVLKLHTPYNEKINFSSYPTDIKHFLSPEYVTKEYYACVQKFVDCSPKSQQKAYGTLKEINCLHSTIKNMAMDGESAIFIDWW